MTNPAEPLLVLRDVRKHFRGVAALAGASLEVRAGEVHALVGQNGAGKSTVIKIVTGAYALDAPGDGGELRFAGAPVRFASPAAARAAGISTIYQEVNLVPQRSVAENMFLGREPRRFGLIDWRRIEREAAAVLEGFGLAIDPRRAVGELSIAEQQMVAISRAASADARLVIMDESTSSLDEREVEVLFSIVRRLKADGRAIVFVSHRLDELYAICDRVTVMRDGATVRVAAMGEIGKVELVGAMLGKELAAVHRRASGQHADVRSSEDRVPRLAVEGLSAPPRLQDASLQLHAGQTLGLAGLLGAGRTELMRAVFGADPLRAGRVLVDGQVQHHAHPSDAIANGLAYLSEDRKTEGIFPDLSVRENLTIAMLPALARAGVVDRAAQRAIVERFVARLGIKARDIEQPIRELSGGNQQKVLLARWIALEPRVLMLDEPTRGIDVGAKADIARLIQELAAAGMALLLTTSELEELVAISDAAVVVRDGRTVAHFDAEAMTEQALMSAMADAAP
jgi:galactofuranose transport system ATP-binding protein